ncbi:hypothetical protein [Tenacibaculum sp. M341]|uniref:hypothetical protein n=1 Tax=Tenacibaculum sp. M341 TaxID=2530339 RepID=UPI001045935E|nr:hypothetical protein [Tenacibaculum sp. M341]TCI93200.1 hypothetical protein EYW44_06175 [Tenacibaculum sp. M341]
MSLKNIYKSRSEILDGHLNELRTVTGLASKDEVAIFSVREKICSSCPLKSGNSCNSKKWMHPKTLEISNNPKEGFVRGCGCRLSAKQKSKHSVCPAKLWGNEF